MLKESVRVTYSRRNSNQAIKLVTPSILTAECSASKIMPAYFTEPVTTFLTTPISSIRSTVGQPTKASCHVGLYVPAIRLS